MKKLLFILLILGVLLLTGCTLIKPRKPKEPSNSGNEIEVNTTRSIEDTYLLYENANKGESENYSNEIDDSYIRFNKDNTFTAYLGFSNMLSGTYSYQYDELNCSITTYDNEYSPTQQVSAYVIFKVLNNHQIQVTASSSTYHVKTTNMNENGEWVFDGGDKDLSMGAFEVGSIFKVLLPEV